MTHEVSIASGIPVLLVEDDVDLRETILDVLTDAGFVAEGATEPSAALPLLLTRPFSLVLTDYLCGTPAVSQQKAEALLDACVGVPVVCISAWSGIPSSVEQRYAMRLWKPLSGESLLEVVSRYACAQSPDPARAATVGQYFHSLERRDWDGLVGLCTESVRYNLPGSDPLCRVVTGRDDLRTYAAATFESFPDARFDVRQVSWLPEGIVASYTARWNSGGRTGESGGAVYFRFDGPRISEIGVRTDTAGLRAHQRA